MRISAFLALLLSATYIILPAQNNSPAEGSWPTTEWDVFCAVIYEESGADYFTDLNDDSDCEYIHADTRDTLTLTELEKWRVIDALERHSNRMVSMGFKPPAIDRPDIWQVVMYPGDCLCEDDDCCETESDSEWYASAELDELLVRSVGDEPDVQQSYDLAHQLFHAVKGSYFSFEERSDETQCAPFCWIGEGMATMMAHSGIMNSDPSSDRKFDESLYTNDIEKAQETGLFWQTTGAIFDPRVLPKVLEQDFSSNEGMTGHGIFQVHQALLDLGVDQGFLNAYGAFARHLQDEKYYSEVQELEVNTVDSDFDLDFQELEPISVQAAKIQIDPSSFTEEISAGAMVTLKVELEGFGESLHLLVDGAGAYPENLIEKDITEMFRNGEPFEIWVQVFNVNPDEPHNSILEHLGEVKVKIEVLECTLMPRDVTNMVYISKNKKGKPQLRMSYNLATAEENGAAEGESREGQFDLHIVILKNPQVQAKAWTEFVCTDEGVILTGTEAAFVPKVGVMDSEVEMNIRSNTNLIPHKPRAGMVLDDAEVILESDGYSQLTGAFGINTHYRLTNRRVIGTETVTVPAGTFETYRIEYDTNASFEFTGKAGILGIMRRALERSASGHNVVWVAEGIGWVKHEIMGRSGRNTYELVELVR